MLWTFSLENENKICRYRYWYDFRKKKIRCMGGLLLLPIIYPWNFELKKKKKKLESQLLFLLTIGNKKSFTFWIKKNVMT